MFIDVARLALNTATSVLKIDFRGAHMTTEDLYVPENFIRNALPIDSTYQYEVLAHHHVNRVVEVFSQTFCLFEPMTQYLQIDVNNFKKFAYCVTQKAAEDQCSVVALDKDRVVGCALVEDLASPGDFPGLDPKFKFVFTLLEQLGSHYFDNKKLTARLVAHLFITAVDREYRHQGISTQLNFHAMDFAMQLGFDFMYCEFTHFFNEKGVVPHLRNRKKLIGSKQYNEFMMDGEKPFAGLEGGANSYLWEIRKNAASEQNPFFSP